MQCPNCENEEAVGFIMTKWPGICECKCMECGHEWFDNEPPEQQEPFYLPHER